MTSNSVGPGQHLLQGDVGDGVLDQDLARGQGGLLLGVGRGLALLGLGPLPLVPGVGLVGELALGQGVAPVAEGALGELHDVALVHQRHALALVGDGVLDRRADQPLAPLARDRLDADGDGLREADLLVHLGEVVLEEREELLDVLGAGLELDAGVDVLGVLAEDHHVDLLGVLDRRGHALEPADRAEADVEVEQLPQRDVERADAAADGRRQRPLDADQVLAERLDRLVGQPGGELVVRLLAGVDLHPLDLPLAAVGLLDGGVEDPHAGAPDVRPGAVAFDERDDRAGRGRSACRR